MDEETCIIYYVENEEPFDWDEMNIEEYVELHSIFDSLFEDDY